MHHNDARGWEGYCSRGFENEESYGISKFMNCPLLQNSFSCPAAAIYSGDPSVQVQPICAGEVSVVTVMDK